MKAGQIRDLSSAEIEARVKELEQLLGYGRLDKGKKKRPRGGRR